jgi:hypothetical protein
MKKGQENLIKVTTSSIIMEWSYLDYRISIISHNPPIGDHWYCGYVQVPKYHKLYGILDYDYIQELLKTTPGCKFPSLWKHGLTNNIGFDTGYKEHENISFCEVLGVALQLLMDMILIQNI